MTELKLSIGEPFTSPAWGSNFVVFTGEDIIREEFSKEYMRRACKYARHYGVYLVPERFLLMDYCCLCLISPEGRVLGAQQALYPSTQVAHSKCGVDLEIMHTEFGGITLCVDVDIYHPEIGRIAEGMGAQYIICAQYVAPHDYGSSSVFTGVWNASQSCGLYVIGVCNQFNCVCAPLAITKYGDGFLATPSMRMPMTATLHAHALLQAQQPIRLSRTFYALHRKELLR